MKRNKNQTKFICFLMCGLVIFSTISPSIVALAETYSSTQTSDTSYSNLDTSTSSDMEDKGLASMTTTEVAPKVAEDINSWMPDQVLQAEVAKQLKLDDVHKITKDEMKLLTNLSFTTETGKDLVTLKGLEFATNLDSLYIQKSQIIDISPLASCVNLKQLYLMFSNITDISPLANLTKLSNLHVDANPFTDYSPIAHLTGLIEFGSRYSNIQDLSFLKEWTNLKRLYLWDNNISNLSPLQNLKNLSLLELSYNNISDISHLFDFPLLRNLYLGANDLTNIDTLANLTSLESLTVHDNHISNISALGGLPNLINLNAQNQTISLEKVMVAGVSYTQSSTIKNRDNSLLPLIPAEQEESGSGRNEQIDWLKLNNSGTFSSSWHVHSAGGNNADYLFSGTVTLPYERQQGETVLVKYIAENGENLQSTVQLTGKIGDAYTAEQKIIDGYTLDKTKLPTNATGTLSDKAQTVTYVYTKNPIIASDVTVSYVDKDGKAIPDVSSQTISGNIGDAYDASTDKYKLVIDGYTLDESKLPTNATGTLSDTAQTVTYVYIKNAVNPKPDHDASKPNNTSDNVLPMTGDNDSQTVIMMFLGFLVTITGVLLTVFKRKNID